MLDQQVEVRIGSSRLSGHAGGIDRRSGSGFADVMSEASSASVTLSPARRADPSIHEEESD